MTLVGSASLAVRFVDAVDRTPIAASDARLSLSSRDGVRVRTVTRPLQVGPAAQPVVIEASLGIELDAGLEAHEAIRRELDPLAPGEHREIVVDVPRGLE